MTVNPPQVRHGVIFSPRLVRLWRGFTGGLTCRLESPPACFNRFFDVGSGVGQRDEHRLIRDWSDVLFRLLGFAVLLAEDGEVVKVNLAVSVEVLGQQVFLVTPFIHK